MKSIYNHDSLIKLQDDLRDYIIVVLKLRITKIVTVVISWLHLYIFVPICLTLLAGSHTPIYLAET